MSGANNVLFDLDGTLTDPKEGIVRSVLYALEQMGVEQPSFESITWLIGPPLQASLATLLKTDDPDVSRKCLDHYRVRFGDVGLYENAVYEGVPELLSTLRTKGFRIYLATSKPTVFAAKILEHFGLSPFFTGIYGSELDGARTDKSDLIQHVVEAEKLDPAACLMVGDRIHDLIGARANGLRFAGALYGYGSREELAGSDFLVERPLGLKSCLT